MTTANKITLFRMILIPVFLVLLYTGHVFVALAVYIAACLSDVADGYIARHYHQVTNFGKFMDPLADKMLVLSAMCFFIENGQMAGWVVAIVLLREFGVSGLRMVAVEQGKVIAAARSGKTKTGVTMLSLGFMMVAPVWWPSALGVIDTAAACLIVLTTVYSGVEYFVKNIAVFQSKSET